MWSGSEAGSYLRFIDFVYHATPGLRVIKKEKKKDRLTEELQRAGHSRREKVAIYMLF